MAEWILSVSGKVTGVRLTAKSTMSTNPYVRICPIDMAKGTKSGDIITLSEGVSGWQRLVIIQITYHTSIVNIFHALCSMKVWYSGLMLRIKSNWKCRDTKTL